MLRYRNGTTSYIWTVRTYIYLAWVAWSISLALASVNYPTNVWVLTLLYHRLSLTTLQKICPWNKVHSDTAPLCFICLEKFHKYMAASNATQISRIGETTTKTTSTKIKLTKTTKQRQKYVSDHSEYTLKPATWESTAASSPAWAFI